MMDILIKKTIKIHIKYFIESEYIKNDKMKIKQIIMNLSSNAIKFTDKGSISLKVEDHQTKKNIILISITDTGIGIPILI